MAALRNLLLVGGPSHPFEESGAALARILDGIGWTSEICFDIEHGLKHLARGSFGQLTVACLRWTMAQNEKYLPLRAEFSFSLSQAGQDTIRAYIRGGHGLLALHAAPISFDSWPEWPALLGIGWVWGQSHHPPYAPASVRMAPEPHPVTQGIPAFDVADEIYSTLAVAPWMKPIFEARHADMRDWQPVGFAGETEGARRAYCGLGHDGASLANPAHARLIQRAAQWVTRQPVTA